MHLCDISAHMLVVDGQPVQFQLFAIHNETLNITLIIAQGMGRITFFSLQKSKEILEFLIKHYTSCMSFQMSPDGGADQFAQITQELGTHAGVITLSIDTGKTDNAKAGDID